MVCLKIAKSNQIPLTSWIDVFLDRYFETVQLIQSPDHPTNPDELPELHVHSEFLLMCLKSSYKLKPDSTFHVLHPIFIIVIGIYATSCDWFGIDWIDEKIMRFWSFLFHLMTNGFSLLCIIMLISTFILLSTYMILWVIISSQAASQGISELASSIALPGLLGKAYWPTLIVILVADIIWGYDLLNTIWSKVFNVLWSSLKSVCIIVLTPFLVFLLWRYGLMRIIMLLQFFDVLLGTFPLRDKDR